MMINQLHHNERLEWTIRVGSLFIVLGVHLWLLFFSPLVDFTWQSSAGSSAAFFSEGKSSRGKFLNDKPLEDSMKSSLSLSFSSVAEPHSFPPKQSESFFDANTKSVSKKSVPNKKKLDEKESPLKTKPSIEGNKVVNPGERSDSLRESSMDTQPRYKKVVEAANTDKNFSQNVVPITGSDQLHANDGDSLLGSDTHRLNDTESAKLIVYKPALVAPPTAPIYPNTARRKKQQGTVWLDVFLDDAGRQKELKVYKTSGVTLLDNAALKAVEQWKFAELQQNYQASHVKIRIPIEFLLN